MDYNILNWYSNPIYLNVQKQGHIFIEAQAYVKQA